MTANCAWTKQGKRAKMPIKIRFISGCSLKMLRFRQRYARPSPPFWPERPAGNKTHIHGWLNGRTDRASLHTSCQQSILIIRLIIKVNVQGSKVKVKVPTCVRATCHARRINYQRLTPYVPITAILHGNRSHFTAQYGSFHRAKWVRLKNDETHVGTHGPCVRATFRLTVDN